MNKPELDPSSSSSGAVSKQVVWPWPYHCHHRPRTLSFRIPGHALDTTNSTYILDTESASMAASSSQPVSPTIRDMSLESVIRLARSDRLFFDPSGMSNSILDEASSSRPSLPLPALEPPVDDDDDDEQTVAPAPLPYNNSVFLSVDSQDPLLDFRESMTEMVMAHGIKDWDGLVELLWWYLKVNDDANHSYVYSAFIDLSFSRAAFSINPAEANSNSSSSAFECSSETLQAGPPSTNHNSPSPPLSFDTSSLSAASSSTLSSSASFVSGLENEDYNKEQPSITSSNSS